MKILLLSLLAASLFAQTARYPSSIATDGNLYVAGNNIGTTLLAPQASTDTVAYVLSSTGIVPNMLISVGTPFAVPAPEVEVVCAVSGNVLTLGTGGVCPSISGRGFDNTAAAAHVQGTAVNVNYVAWHRNSDRKEIEAIETALGVNLANVPAGTPGAAGFSSSIGSATYNFTTQHPSGSLSIGANSITMAPVPLGVNGADSGHWLYVSGTGTPEACAVTGGAGTSGQSSGTIILTCAHTHSAGYAVSSATAGIEEAIVANPWNAISLPCSLVHTQATITLPPTVGLDLGGCGKDQYAASGSVISNDDTTGTVAAISMTNTSNQQQVHLHDFAVTCTTVRTCGTHLSFSDFYGLVVERLWLVGSGGYGLYCNQCVSAIIRDNVITHTSLHGMFLDRRNNQVEIVHNTITDSSWTNGYANLQIVGTSGNENLSVLVQNNDIEVCGGNPAHAGVTACNNIAILNSFGVSVTGENYLEGAFPSGSLNLYCGANARNIEISGNRFQDGAVTIDAGCNEVEFGPNSWDNYSSIATNLSVFYSGAPSFTFHGRQTVEPGSGTVTFNAAPYAGGTAVSGAVTLNAQSGTIASESLTTAAGSIYTLTLTDYLVAATSIVNATVELGTSTNGTPQIVSVTPGAGSVVIKVKNIDGSNAFNGTIQAQFAISNLK